MWPQTLAGVGAGKLLGGSGHDGDHGGMAMSPGVVVVVVVTFRQTPPPAPMTSSLLPQHWSQLWNPHLWGYSLRVSG